MPTDFHSSRWRASSTSRMIGLLRTSFFTAYSNGSISFTRKPGTSDPARPGGVRKDPPLQSPALGVAPPSGPALHPLRGAQLRAPRPWIAAELVVSGHDRFFRQHFHGRV